MPIMDSFTLLLFCFFQGNGTESDISLDDINLGQGGSCAYFASTTEAPSTPQTTAYECNFEDNSFCFWTVESTDKPWIIASGQTAVYGKAPLTDHTRQNLNGKYAYVPIEATGGPVAYSTLGFRGLPQGVSFCLEFWYQAFVSSDTTLNVYLQNGSSPTTLIWRRPGTTARNQWMYGSVNLETIRSYVHLTMSGKMTSSRNALTDNIFLAVVVPRTTGYIALDDIRILNGACPSAAICDFEDSSICGYENDITANFGWLRHAGSTSTSTTGATSGQCSIKKIYLVVFSRYSI